MNKIAKVLQNLHPSGRKRNQKKEEEEEEGKEKEKEKKLSGTKIRKWILSYPMHTLKLQQCSKGL